MPIPFLPKRISSFRVSFGELRTKGSEEALGGFKVMQLTLVLGTALQQVTGVSYRHVHYKSGRSVLALKMGPFR